MAVLGTACLCPRLFLGTHGLNSYVAERSHDGPIRVADSDLESHHSIVVRLVGLSIQHAPRSSDAIPARYALDFLVRSHDLHTPSLFAHITTAHLMSLPVCARLLPSGVAGAARPG